MLARKTTLRHPLGTSLETPLLVPSFSSKGFGYSFAGKSEIGGIFEVAAEYLTDAMLVSAYDIHYERLPRIESAITEVVFVDSGGYEVSDQFDLSTVFHLPVSPNDWTEEKLYSELDRWPAIVPAVFVSFDRPDNRRPLSEQIASANKMRGRYPKQLTCFLIKPETPGQKFVQMKNILANVDEFATFALVGVTEKELGNSTLQRMINISRIRIAMDDNHINVPIHVFGSLDPVCSILYFLAGAEIFDGLTWLRYGYADGAAQYQSSFGARHIGIDVKDDMVKARSIRDNTAYLRRLQLQMSKFLLDGDFGKFAFDAPNREFFRESFDLLRTKNAGVK